MAQKVQTCAEDICEDPLEYPFLSALLAPFGPEAILPFEEHLRALHSECSHRHGGCWFKMASPRKARSTLEQVTESEGEAEAEAEAQVEAEGESATACHLLSSVSPSCSGSSRVYNATILGVLLQHTQ